MNAPPTYIGGKTTIDFIFVTPGVLEATRQCGITTFHQVITSDHTGIYVNLSITQLFAGILHDLQIHKARRVGTKQLSQSETFQERATANIGACKVTKQLSALEEDYNNTEILNKEHYEIVDQDLHQSVIDAETSLPKVPKAWWTPDIGHKFRLLQYWRAKLSFARNKMEGMIELGLLKKQLPDDIDIFQGDKKRGIRALVRKAAKELRKVRSNSFDKGQDHFEKKALLAVH
eukprot:1652259-Ditylum_brightwellii.AAC.1